MKAVLHNVEDVRTFCSALYQRELPVRVAVAEGGDRSLDQNSLAWQWAQDIAQQRGDVDSQYVHGINKLEIGIGIRKEDDSFAEVYDRLIRPLSYEDKLSLMQPPIDFPVTRDMGVKQMTRFLDATYHYWTAKGVVLTLPEGPL